MSYEDLLAGLLGDVQPAPAAPLPPERLYGALDASQTITMPPSAREVAAARMRASFARFAWEAWSVLDSAPLEWNWHHKAFCDHLQELFLDQLAVRRRVKGARQRFRKFLANVPPGTSKSRFISVLFPAWAWTIDPTWSLIALSTTPLVAQRDADLHQQLVSSQWYRETFATTWTIRPDASAKGNFENTEGGRRISRGMGAKIIGLRADCILVDDPHDIKDLSDQKRAAVLTAWPSVANRVNDRRTAIYVGVCQRAHEEDWSALFLKERGVVHLDLPAEYPAPPCPCRHCVSGASPIGWSDPRARADFRPSSAYGPQGAGKVLHPRRMTLESLLEDLGNGELYYATQLQQRPSPAGGLMFKAEFLRWVQLEQLPAKFDYIVVSVDCAAKKESGAKTLVRKSRTALGLWGIKGTAGYLLDAVAEHLEPTFDTAAIVLSWTDGRAAPPGASPLLQSVIDGCLARRAQWAARGRITGVYVEAKAAGPSVITALSAELPCVVPVETGSDDKESRANAALPSFRAGSVMVLAGQPWNESWKHEHLSFPHGAYDDQVDQTTQLVNEVLVQGGAAHARQWLSAGPPGRSVAGDYGPSSVSHLWGPVRPR